MAVSGTAAAPLFLTGNADWTLTNASILWAANSVQADGVTYNGGTRYLPRTDGQRNDCFERFFLTVSPRYEEVLPKVPNPVSPWKAVTGTHLWRAHPASNREQDGKLLDRLPPLGHDPGRDHRPRDRLARRRRELHLPHPPRARQGGRPGPVRLRPAAPGQAGLRLRPLQQLHRFRAGERVLDDDLVSRTPDNQLQHAWMRCYAPKPARAVEYCARLAPRIQEKFHFSTAYCDVHTAVAPWDRVDYDARVPGAGTLSAVFYAFGEIMLHQKQAWNGPVYCEGNNHAFYCGLTDGNYGQDQAYRPADEPLAGGFRPAQAARPLLQFRHGQLPTCSTPASPRRRTRPSRKTAWLDRFLAATVAFGHPGFLVFEGGIAQCAAELLHAPATAQPVLPGQRRRDPLRRCRAAACSIPPPPWPRAHSRGPRW